MHIHRYRARNLLALLATFALSACGSIQVAVEPTTATTVPQATATMAQLSQDNIQATIEAGIKATQEARPSAATTMATPSETIIRPDATATTRPEATAPAQKTEQAEAATADVAGSSDQAAPATTFKPINGTQTQTVNLELVFDASGSMAQQIPGSNETRIAAARRAMSQVIDQLPDNNTNLNVGFRVYGHKGDNTDAGKAESCQSTDLLVPVQGINKNVLRQQTGAFEPTGWTPISLALQKAGEDLQAGENVRNVIIMVTDGEETCGGDPCAVAKALNESGAEVRIDVVGFGQDPTLRDKLQCVPDNSGGVFIDANNGDALAQSLEELIVASIRRSYLRIIALGPNGQVLGTGQKWQGAVDITKLVDAQGNTPQLKQGELANQGRRTNLEDLGDQTLELAPGTYQFTIAQILSYNGLRGFLPENNTEMMYTAEIVEGQTTTAIIGIGSITVDGSSQPDPAAFYCGLALEVEIGGKWRPGYRPDNDPATSCSDTNGQRNSAKFEDEIPVLPGRYRVVDAERSTVIADNIEVVPGKMVTVRIK